MIGYTEAELAIREQLGLPYATGTDQDIREPELLAFMHVAQARLAMQDTGADEPPAWHDGSSEQEGGTR